MIKEASNWIETNIHYVA
ncbi:Protein of unknown function [Bacillus thuringiensis]|uniref:Uncharacterized protein n=1 Tax=Bacillus thuringiensis TaxID=1428 RepID=A0A1C4F701_BACTU|nr:Protein of unknown function [Bacillus thuringiensis]